MDNEESKEAADQSEQENPENLVFQEIADADLESGNEENKPDRSETDQLKSEVSSKNDQLLRAAAEIENIRKRGRRDTEEAKKYASSGLLTDILSVVDDLDRAAEAAESNQEGTGLLDGVKMVAAQLKDVLEKHHCSPVEAIGKPFDPNRHEAIQMQPSDQVPANHISLVARIGYQFHDRVLRTAQVFVSTGNSNDENSNDENSNNGVNLEN